MKKGVCFAAALLLGLSMMGCQSSPQTAATETEKQSVKAETETESESETESETETETEKETEAQQTNTIIGSMEEIDMDQITVLTDNGNEVILSIRDSELDFRNGFRVGNLVSVEYTGEIVEKDSTAGEVKVARVADSADVKVIPGEESESESGTGSDMDSEKTEGESETTKESVKDQESENPESENPESANQEDADTEETEENTEPREPAKELKGAVEHVAMGEMTIVTEEEQELTFKIANVRMYFAKGMTRGTKVVVSYTGEVSGADTDQMNVLSVENDTAAGEKVKKEKPKRQTSESGAETGSESESESVSGSQKETDSEKGE